MTLGIRTMNSTDIIALHRRLLTALAAPLSYSFASFSYVFQRHNHLFHFEGRICLPVAARATVFAIFSENLFHRSINYYHFHMHFLRNPDLETSRSRLPVEQQIL